MQERIKLTRFKLTTFAGGNTLIPDPLGDFIKHEDLMKALPNLIKSAVFENLGLLSSFNIIPDNEAIELAAVAAVNENLKIRSPHMKYAEGDHAWWQIFEKEECQTLDEIMIEKGFK